MTYSVDIIEDSIACGVRLTSVCATFPRIILAEQNTHRVFSRNTASSRAIPVKTRCDSIENDPFIPLAFGKNKKGMQSDEFLDLESNMQAEKIWKEALSDALKHARKLSEIGVHKQYANRLTEPFSWVTQIITSTEWENYFNLRAHPAAQPEIQIIAKMIKDAMAASLPKKLKNNQWHLPFTSEDERFTLSEENLLKLSVARCAAVSYEKHNIKKSFEEEFKRHDDMILFGHMSPFEHQAKPAKNAIEYFDKIKTPGNLPYPWIQYRKLIPGEQIFNQK